MTKYILNLISRAYINAANHNNKNILKLIPYEKIQTLLDIGCGDGLNTIRYSQKSNASETIGIELESDSARISSERGIKVLQVDVCTNYGINDSTVDLAISNQVIEHVSDIDKFAYNLHRVLKTGGYAIISTENSSSWCNIFASLMGWQIFSSTNISKLKSGLGNPLALHRNSSESKPLMTHKTIFSYRGLKEFFEAHQFEVISLQGAGYFPLPSIFAKYDPRHSHFITILLKKKN